MEMKLSCKLKNPKPESFLQVRFHVHCDTLGYGSLSAAQITFHARDRI